MDNIAPTAQTTLRVRVKEFEIPPIRDALVLGRKAPIGCVAMRKSLSLLVPSTFEHIELDDDTVSDILVRQALLRRVDRNALITFVLERLKPMMGPEEILQLSLEVEHCLEAQV